MLLTEFFHTHASNVVHMSRALGAVKSQYLGLVDTSRNLKKVYVQFGTYLQYIYVICHCTVIHMLVQTAGNSVEANMETWGKKTTHTMSVCVRKCLKKEVRMVLMACFVIRHLSWYTTYVTTVASSTITSLLTIYY